jgi:hypothetical protein
MGRPHFHPARCRICGKKAEEVGGISQTGLCPEHSHERFAANLDAMKSMRGPFAQWWAFRMAASVGYAPLDEAVERP